MSNKKQTKNINLIKNYRRIFGVSCIVHLLCLIAFVSWDMKLLMYYTVAAVLLHGAGAYFVAKPQLTTFCLVAIFAEIVILCALCNYFLGWGYGFTFYGVLLIPLCFFNTYMDSDIKHPWLNCQVFVFADLSCMIISLLSGRPDNLYEVYGYSRMREFFFGNMLISMLGVAFYAGRIYQLLKLNEEALEEKNHQLVYLANYDNLTKLRNRNNIVRKFRELEKETDYYCVIIGDIDDFKKINDTYGHGGGDTVLAFVAEVLRGQMNEMGIACRWGGEEFLLICSADKEETFQAIEHIRGIIESGKIIYEGKEIRVTMTFGISGSDESDSYEEMIILADKRLYSGKRNGKNQTVYR